MGSCQAEGNRRKHGISFELAVSVFDDPRRLEFTDAAREVCGKGAADHDRANRSAELEPRGLRRA